MREDFAEIIRKLQEARQAVTASVDGDPHQAETADDIDLALGWVISKLEILATRQGPPPSE
jgi:hypothetical protein